MSTVVVSSLHAARSAAEQGQHAKAARHYNKVVKQDRRNPGLLLEAGVNAAQGGDLDLARKYLQHALKFDEANPDIHYNLGHVELNSQSYSTAREAFERVRALDSSYPEVCYSLAEALYGLGLKQEALPSAQRAVQDAPRDVDALMLLARCEYDLGQFDNAGHALSDLLSVLPNHADAHLMLASIYGKQFLSKQVSQHLAVVMKTPDLPLKALLRAGNLYGTAGLTEGAKQAADRALALAPDNSATHTLYASTQIDLGDFDLAEEHFRKALDLDAQNSLSFQGLADIKRLSENDRSPLEELYETVDADNKARTHCGFALYHLNDKAGRYEEAFSALETANRLMSQDDPQDVRKAQVTFLHLLDIITKDFLIERRSQGFDAAGPVFIVGMPRSGTTLVEQVIAGHPNVLAGGERPDVNELRRTIADFPDGILNFDGDWARRAGEKTYNSMFSGATHHTHATDKLPGNYAYAGLIKWVLPNAKFVYCRRRPEANTLSLFEQHFVSLPFSRNLDDIAIAYAAHEEMIRHWRESCGIAMFEVNYDDFVKDPEPIARGLFDHLGLDWTAAYLDVSKVDRAINTASRWQVRQSINTKSVEKWRRYEQQLQPFLLGLERERQRLT